MSTALTTLRDHEEWLELLVEALDASETDEQRELVLSEMTTAIPHAIDKRDRVFGFLQHCDTKTAAIDKEVKRLQSLKSQYGTAREHVADSAVRVILDLGTDPKGKYRKLEGSLCKLGVAKNPDSLGDCDPNLIPDQFKSVSFTLQATAWEELMSELDMDVRAKLLAAIRKPDITINKVALKGALKNGPVPGAQLASASYRLDVK